MILPFDVETTGLYSKSKPLTDPAQPHLVSISALQYDSDAARVIQSLSVLVCPEGWAIPEEVIAIHGITNEFASEHGMPEQQALDAFLRLWNGKHQLVGHNVQFDQNIIACAIARYHGDGPLLHEWLAASCYCTMNESKRIVNAQTRPDPTGKTRLKAPRLGEAYEFFMGEPYSNAHSANADAVACLRVWIALQEHQA
jgi:DNA polymerase-3 subunit epsilon